MADLPVSIGINASKKMLDMGDGTYAERIAIVNQDGQHEEVNENYMLWLQSLINGTMTEYVLAYQPITTNQTVIGVLSCTTY